jgi:hypothetical protein
LDWQLDSLAVDLPEPAAGAMAGRFNLSCATDAGFGNDAALRCGNYTGHRRNSFVAWSSATPTASLGTVGLDARSASTRYLQARVARMAKCNLAVAIHVLVELDARPSFGQHHFQRGLAEFQRITPQIIAVFAPSYTHGGSDQQVEATRWLPSFPMVSPH